MAERLRPLPAASAGVVLTLLLAAVPLPGPAQTEASGSAAERSVDPQLRQRLEDMEQANQALQRELARLRKTAATARTFDERNLQLETRLVEMERELLLARKEATTLRDRSDRDWFLRGAGVLLLGLVLGALLPRLQRRKPQRWSDL